MRRVSSWLVGAVGLGLLALGVGGCLFGSETIGSGDSARTWSGGKLTRIYAGVSYEKVWAAATGAAQDLKLKVESEQHDAMVGRLKVRRSDNITVSVALDSLGEKQTRVSIRSGAIGRDRDKQAAMTMMDAIDKRVGK